MLRSLYIQNYALIEKLDIRFDTGFSVITGETGAGKSIILAQSDFTRTTCRCESYPARRF